MIRTLGHMAACCAAVALLLANLARAQDLPDAAYPKHVVSLVVFDVTKLTPDAIGASLKTLVAEQDYRALELDKALPLIAEAHRALTDAGIMRAVLVIEGSNSDGPDNDPRFLLNVREGTDPQAVRDVFVEALNAPRFEAAPVDAAWVMLTDPHEADRDFGRADAGLRQQLDAALKQAGDAAIAAVFVPSSSLRQAAAQIQLPPGPNRLMRIITDSQAARASLVLGEAPSVEIAVQQTDPAAAEAAMKSWTQGVEQSRQMIEQHGDALPAPVVMLVDLLASLPLAQTGDALTVSLDAQQLKPVAAVVLESIVMARQQARQLHSAANIRMIAIAVIMYANENRNRYPDTLEQLRPYIDQYETVMTNPRTGQANGYIYKKPAQTTNEIDLATTPMIWEATADGQPDPNANIGYADGHVEWNGSR